MMMDLRTISRFLAVAELGSLNKAAQRLNLSQPALSKSIQLLEMALGVPLLDRGPRGITLTSFGETVFEHARRISAETRKMESDIEAIRTLGSGEINVGAPLGPDSRTLAFAILRLVTDNRRITINIANGTRSDLIRPLLLGDLDFLIATLFEPEDTPPDIEQSELYLDSMILAVRAGHPILHEHDIELLELVNYPWVVLSGNRDLEGALRKLVDVEFKKSLLRSGSPMFVKNILQRSDFIGLVRQDSVRIELESGTLVEIDISAKVDLAAMVPPQKVGLIFRSDVSIPMASQALIKEIIQATRSDVSTVLNML
jgi:DNA-binding transcriptional LysR family regulator